MPDNEIQKWNSALLRLHNPYPEVDKPWMSTKGVNEEAAEESCGRESSKVVVPRVLKDFIIGVKRSRTWQTRVSKKVEEGDTPDTPNTQRANNKSSEEMLH